MRATDFTRNSCKLGARRIRYQALEREYRCDHCDGRLVQKYTSELGWHVHCGRCGGFDFIHERKLLRQEAEAIEVLDGLPKELREALG